VDAARGEAGEVGVVAPDVVEQLGLLNGVIARSAIVISVLSFLFALYMTHYIAGPIYRFERTFERLRAGDLSVQVRLRKRDEFQEVARLFNESLVSVRQQIRRERDGVDAAATRLTALSASLRESGNPSAALQVDETVAALRSNGSNLTL